MEQSNWIIFLHLIVLNCERDDSGCDCGVLRRQPHRRSGLATLPSVGAVP